jgi:hypothetical protein
MLIESIRLALSAIWRNALRSLLTMLGVTIGVAYMNDGDWVESCTALVEHHDGRWEIVTWTKEKDNVDTDNISSSYKRLKRRAGTDRTDIPRPASLPTGFNYN